MFIRAVFATLMCSFLVSMLIFPFNVSTVKAKTIIVPDNFATIQDAINFASPGDAIYVRKGVYYERQATINKPLTLVGEDKNFTIVDGNGSWVCIYVQSTYNVKISGFMIRNGYGVYLYDCKNVTISDNIISSNGQGIIVLGSVGNMISGNIVTQNGLPVLLSGSNRNIICDNVVTLNSGDAIWLDNSNENIISGNNVSHNGLGTSPGYHVYGLRLSYSNDNTIYHNNVIGNYEQANNWQSTDNAWDNGYPSGGNYWSDYTGVDADGDGIGDTPFVIDSEDVDRYPLIKPWPTIPGGEAKPRKVGVNVGDWAKYEITFDYSTNDTNPPISLPPPSLEEIEHLKVAVESIVDTNITFQITVHFKNDTEWSNVMWTDINGSFVAAPFFIAANLSAGDKLYPMYPYSPVINATIMRTYVGAEREVNYVGFIQNTTYTPYVSIPLNPRQKETYSAPYRLVGEAGMYWDRTTGVLDELFQDLLFINQSASYVTHVFMRLAIKETNIWCGRMIVIIDAKTGLSSIALGRGCNFTVNVTLCGDIDFLHCFQVAIAFDNAKVKCTGAWVSRSDPNFVFYEEKGALMRYMVVDNRGGFVAFGSSLLSDYVVPDHELPHYVNVSETRLLCQINFTAIEVGTSSLEIISAESSDYPYATFMLDANNNSICFNGKDFSINVLMPEFLSVFLNICPETLNLKSKGKWITACLIFPKGYNLAEIDVSSIMLNETIPVSRQVSIDVTSSCLIVKFERQAVIDLILKNQQATRKCRCERVTLTITGRFENGVSFKGSDTIRILKAHDPFFDSFTIDNLCKKFGATSSKPGWDPDYDINNDGMINMRDIGIACSNFG